MYAIVETGGKQYKVEEGQTFSVEKIEGEAGSKISLDKVLLFSDGKEAKIGQPYLEGASVLATKVEDTKDKKVLIYKFKRRKDTDVKKGTASRILFLESKK